MSEDQMRMGKHIAFALLFAAAALGVVRPSLRAAETDQLQRCHEAQAESTELVGIVLFDEGESVVEGRMQVILEALHRIIGGRETGSDPKLLLIGHADQLGSPEVNLRLSHRRASAVGEALSRIGTLRSQVEVVACGETLPLIPQGSGGPHPHNRRVELKLRR